MWQVTHIWDICCDVLKAFRQGHAGREAQEGLNLWHWLVNNTPPKSRWSLSRKGEARFVCNPMYPRLRVNHSTQNAKHELNNRVHGLYVINHLYFYIQAVAKIWMRYSLYYLEGFSIWNSLATFVRQKIIECYCTTTNLAPFCWMWHWQDVLNCVLPKFICWGQGGPRPHVTVLEIGLWGGD